MVNIKKYIIGNWKSNKNIVETVQWFTDFSAVFQKNSSCNLNNLELVVCPPFIGILTAFDQISKLKTPISLGVQDISPFSNGAYTGEVTGEMVSEYVKYALIGHSERRQYFKEDVSVLENKVKMAIENNITPVYCVPDGNTYIPSAVTIAAYEPVWAIGTGKSENPENAAKVIKEIKKNNPQLSVLYGGSVNSSNVVQLLTQDTIDGVLPGKSSLDPAAFWEMITNAASV
jgi:triosephosphate isomerase (TIM)